MGTIQRLFAVAIILAGWAWAGEVPSDTPEVVAKMEREIEAYYSRGGWPAAKCYDIGIFEGYAYAGKAPYKAYERDAADAFVKAGLLSPAEEPASLPYGEERGAALWFELTDLGRPYARPGEHAMCFGSMSKVTVVSAGPPHSTALSYVRTVTYSYTVSDMPEFTQKPPFSDRLRAPKNGHYTLTVDLERIDGGWGWPGFHDLEAL